MNDYNWKIKAISDLREIVKKFEGKQINKRIKTEFDKLNTGFNLYYNKDIIGKKICIWGSGIPYDDRLSLHWTPTTLTGELKPESEYTLLMQEIDRADPSDVKERQEIENQYFSLLEEYEEQIKTLKAEIKGKVEKIAEQLPTPKSAKLRKDRSFWDDWSYETRKKFPELFGGLR